jgi:two-component sensor histidine kinase
MALIHEMLYQTEDLAEIDFGAYLRTLIPALIRSYGTNAVRVSHEIIAAAIPVRTETAVPLGLIVNELITNSLKHAFPSRRAGRISIEFRKLEEKAFSLIVRDDGVGLPEGFSIEKTSTLGLRLVGMMAGQLSGRFEAHSRDGAHFALTFEIPDATPAPAIHEL